MLKRFCWKNEIFQEQSYPDRLSNVRKLCSNGGFLEEQEKYRVTEQSKRLVVIDPISEKSTTLFDTIVILFHMKMF